MNEGLHNSKGFTLIETLTAMMILAISLTIILQLFSGGLKSARLSDDYTRAIFHAKEKMEEVLLLNQLREDEFEGKFEDDFRWAVSISLPHPENEEQQNKPGLYLFNIQVTVLWKHGSRERSFEIDTIHIAEKTPELS